jgi:hypothetical protein
MPVIVVSQATPQLIAVNGLATQNFGSRHCALLDRSLRPTKKRKGESLFAATMPKMVTNDVATLLMLDPTNFPIDDTWNLVEMSSKIRRFAGHLGAFADTLDRRRRGARRGDTRRSSVSSSDEKEEEEEEEEEDESEDSAATAPKAATTAGSRRSTRTSAQKKKSTGGRVARSTRSPPRKKNGAASVKKGRGRPKKTPGKKRASKESSSDVSEDEESDDGDTDDPNDTFSIADVVGTYVAKKFSAGMFRGVVQSVDGEGRDALYHVKYTDKDEEDLSPKEMHSTLFLWLSSSIVIKLTHDISSFLTRNTEALFLFANCGRQSAFAGIKKSKRADKPLGTEWFTRGLIPGEKRKSRQVGLSLISTLKKGKKGKDDDIEMKSAEPAETVEGTAAVEGAAAAEVAAEDAVADDQKPAAQVEDAVHDAAAADMSTPAKAAATADEPADDEMGSAAAIAEYAVQSPEDDEKKNKRRRV